MLPHRDAFEKSLRMALDMAALREDTVGVVLIHIGGYITYQRVFDSALANRLMEAAARVVLENLSEGRANLPRLARVSDDVIGVVLTEIRSRAEADAAIEAIIKSLRHPVDLEGQAFQLAPQAGVTLSGSDGTRAAELIDRALTTLDAGRHRGPDRLVTFYSDTLRLASLTRLDWQEELTQAIRKDELELHYQPRLTLATREIIAVEAFLRWPHKIRGLVPTSEFLPIAELSGLSVQLGRWVLRRACRDLATLAQNGYSSLRVSVNVGPPIPFGGKPCRRRGQFGARSGHRTLTTGSGNHRADAVDGTRRASPPCTSCAARVCACSSMTSARATCRSGGCVTAPSTAS